MHELLPENVQEGVNVVTCFSDRFVRMCDVNVSSTCTCMRGEKGQEPVATALQTQTKKFLHKRLTDTKYPSPFKCQV